ncbi:MAG: DUF2934 domain-containing protein [Methylococcaceae bacterium]|nr:DUF2934 domain-containing protein [Methylococcaceae bacterium]
MTTIKTNGTDSAATLIEVEKAILQRRIAEAAYYRAQKRGFEPGFEEEDWVEAEREILCALQNTGDF